MGVVAGGDDSSEELPAAGQDHTSIYIYYAQHTCICRYCINDPVLHIYIYYKHYIGCAN